jgi:hypothetical protein
MDRRGGFHHRYSGPGVHQQRRQQDREQRHHQPARHDRGRAANRTADNSRSAGPDTVDKRRRSLSGAFYCPLASPGWTATRLTRDIVCRDARHVVAGVVCAFDLATRHTNREDAR